MEYLESFFNGYAGYASYLWQEITNPGWHNYFYWLLGVSAFFFLLEIFSPWRQGQPKFRKDFWLDFFYMFFNFFLFSLIIYNAASEVVVKFFNNIIQAVSGFDLQASNPMNSWPMWAILLTGFVVRDFVQWWTHRLLHRSSTLWEFHKVHHSVEQMGFAAHLRYHWMENIVYRSIEYLPLALLGIFYLNGGTLDRLNAGDAIMVLSALFWGIQVYLLGTLARETGMPVFVSVASFAATGILSAAFGLAFEAPTIAGIAAGWVEILYAAILSTAVAYSLQAIVPPANAAIILSSESLFAALGGALLLGERLPAIGYAGAALIFFAILLVEAVPAWPQRRPAAARP